MIKTTPLLLCLIMLVSGCNKNENEILSKTISKLESLESIEYRTTNHDVNKKMGRDRIDRALCYFDFSSNDTLIGAKYQFDYEGGEQVFNGNQEFSSLDQEKVVLFNNTPDKRRVNSSIFMLQSLLEMKKLLPELKADTTITINRTKDTIIDNTECYRLDIKIPNRYIGMGSELTMSENNSIDFFNYNLMISKKDYLPIQFRTVYEKESDFKTITFSDYNELSRSDSIWNYDRFPKDYLRFTPKDYFGRMRTKNLSKVGKTAPEWSLKDVNDKVVTLSELNSDLVLLEFWFPYCKGCVLAVPDINEIHEKYSEKGLSVYGIEFTNSKREYLVDYIEKQGIEYPTLVMGEEIADQYGVYAAPTFYLLDTKGTIIYTSVGLNKNELAKALDENLKL